MTHRVSECHGFALLEYGEIKRLYCHDEEEIQVIGKPLEIEEKLGIKLPRDFDEMWEHWKDDTMTKMNEDIIVQLANEQNNIGKKQYLDGLVQVGTLISK